MQLTQQYADFALTPEYEAKDKYLCIEYENLKGDITLYVAYDDGDNNWDNPFDSIELNPTNTKVILKLDESKMIASKKMKIKWQRKNENGDTEIKINKIYFTSGDSC